MSVKKISWFVLVILVTSFLITVFQAPVGNAAETGAEEPKWHEEDQWDYNLQVSGYDYSYDYTVVVNDTDTEYELKDEVYDCYKIEWKMEGMDSQNQTILRTKDGLDKAKEGDSQFYPPLNELDFPLTVGKSWSQDVSESQDFSLNTTLTTNYTYEYDCKEETTITLNGEDFECYRIDKTRTEKNTTETRESELYYSPRAKRIVKRIIHVQSTQGQTNYIFKLTSFSISPTRPRDLNATVEGDDVELNWTEPEYPGGSDIKEYRIYRWEDNSSELLASVEGKTNYTDYNVSEGENYGYEVSAVNDKGEGDISQNVGAEIPEEDEDGFITNFWWIIAVIAAIAIISMVLYRNNKRKRYERPPQRENRRTR